MNNQAGTLSVVATPIGNLADITLRAIAKLRAADFIYAEDTRVSSKLLQHHQISTRVGSYHDFSDDNKRQQIIKRLQEGAAVALISDAGTPLIADPGYKLVRQCLDLEIKLDACPGPCAAINALVLSGLPSDQFTFYGFYPTKAKLQLQVLGAIKNHGHTSIFYLPARLLLATLKQVQVNLGEASVAVAREMTKNFQEVKTGTAFEVEAFYQENPDRLRGEIVLLIKAPETKAKDEQVLQLAEPLLSDYPTKTIAAIVAKQTGRSKGEVYQLLVGRSGID